MSVLADRVAIVTGAAKGIGSGIARQLAAAGAATVVNYRHDRAGADRLVAGITGMGGRALAVQADVTLGAEVQRLFAETITAFGPPDIVVNNAGVYSFQPLQDIEAAEFHRQFNANVLASLLVAQQAIEFFPPAGGSIINIGSTASQNPDAGAIVYAASKSALDAASRAMALELGPRGIRVNVLAPGGVDTEGTRANGVVGGDVEQRIIAATPLGRFGQPDDIGKVAVFLASPASAWITGERIAAAGGFR